MLRLSKITIDNFGPFKGQQTIEFDREDGVSLVYGENMRGKTSLINAIRYALFGKVISRGARELALHQIGNWEAGKEGAFGFKVVLNFEHDGAEYELTRQCSKRDGVTTPQTDHDYVQRHFLKCNGNVMSPDEGTLALTQIMPEQVSRFFLFDGELLQQYEELLRNDSDMGRQIKESVERILGVPILTNARLDLAELRKDAERQESNAAQKDQRTRELGTHNAQEMDKRVKHEEEISRLRAELELLKQKKNSKEEMLRKTERIKALMQERDALTTQVAELDKRMIERTERLKEMNTEAWVWLLRPCVHDIQEQLQNEVEGLRHQELKREMAKKALEDTEQALAKKLCHACQQPLPSKYEEELRGLLANLRAEASAEGQRDKLDAKLGRLAVLKKADLTDKTDAVREIVHAIEDSRIDRANKRGRIDEIDEQTKDLDESEIRKLMSDYDKTVQEIGIVERGIKAEQERLGTVNENIRRLQAELDRVGGADLARERRRREIYSTLYDLFTEGVHEFRERLRVKVAADATDLFRQLTTEPDYDRLSINENYGLTIIHKDGGIIPVRSAGAEHIVALSLMGALQKNAPLQGPIIMDSPFGRLDAAHTTRVIATLPNMARQVMLLVYESELEPQRARNGLKGNLRREYRIIRKTAKHSVLERNMGNQ